MAFKLSIAEKVNVPVKFSMADGSKIKHYAFTLLCSRLTEDEFQASIRDDEGKVSDEKAKQKMLEITSGWQNQTFVCNEDDSPADFCHEALDVMLSAPGVLGIAVHSYRKENSARAKN